MTALTRTKPIRAGALALALGVTLAAPQIAPAAISSSVGAGTLNVQSDAGDGVAIVCTGNNAKINGNDPGSGAFPCASITAFVINGGPIANAIDLGGVAVFQFSALNTVTANGNGGDDTFIGTPLGDTLDGGAGDDNVLGAGGVDRMLGGADDDKLVWNNGDGSDVMDGADGKDTVEVNGATAAGDAFTVAPRTVAGRVRFARTNLVEFTLDIATTEKLAVNGLGGDDSISGATGLKGLVALAFAGHDGNDAINGGDGDDFLDGGAGEDTIDGGAGDDRLQGVAGNDLLKGGSGDDRVKGGTGHDVFKRGTGNDALDGGDGKDQLNGGTGNDVLQGGDGRDKLTGGSGNDKLKGGADRDVLEGQGGADRLTGNGGKDSFSGGSGNDRLSSKGQRRERVSCGSGKDRATGTRGDRVKRNCERVSR